MPRSGVTQETLDRLMAGLEISLEREKTKIRETERLFHIQTGARLAIDALHRSGALHTEANEGVQTWIKDGGLETFTYGGIKIWPVIV